MTAAVLGACGEPDTEPQPPPPPRERLPVARVYMGVSCPESNSFRCDRVGLAVWLPTRPRRLEASIAGRPLRLRWQSQVPGTEFGITSYRRVHYYVGFLRPAGLIDGPLRLKPEGRRYHWTGAKPVTADVRLFAHYAGGRSQHRALRVGLAAGWG